MTALQLQQDGNLYLLPEYPEEPVNQRDVTAEYAEVMVEYEQAIERSKSNAILVKNQEEAFAILVKRCLTDMFFKGNTSQSGRVYFLEGYEAEITSECEWKGDPESCCNEFCWDLDVCQKSHMESLALIKPQSIKQ